MPAAPACLEWLPYGGTEVRLPPWQELQVQGLVERWSVPPPSRQLPTFCCGVWPCQGLAFRNGYRGELARVPIGW